VRGFDSKQESVRALEKWQKQDRLWLLVLCVLALMVRVVAGIGWPNIPYPDEIYQYVEPAHRLVYGTGLVPWEFHIGARSWMIPGVLSAIIWIAGLFSTAPSLYFGATTLFMAAITLPGIVAAFALGRRECGILGALIAAGLNACWFESVYLSVHPLADTFSAALLLPGAYFCVADERMETSARRFFWAGLLLTAAVAVRVQLGPAVLLLMLLTVLRQRFTAWLAMFAGAIIPIVLAGATDWIAYSSPFHSYVAYIRANALEDKSSDFGVLPWYAYIGYHVVDTLGLTILLGLAAAIGSVRLPKLAVTALALLLTFSAVAHKEVRFIYPAIPIYLTLAGVGTADLLRWLASRRGLQLDRRRAVRLGTGVVLGWSALSLLVGAFGPFGHRWEYRSSAIHAARVVNRDPAACGVSVFPGELWYETGGYSYLRPHIFLADGGSPSGPAEPGRGVDYIMVIDGTPFASTDFTKVQCWDERIRDVCLWHRAGPCDASAATPLAGVEGAPIH
jgi:phosphatidylinositol glycan class B